MISASTSSAAAATRTLAFLRTSSATAAAGRRSFATFPKNPPNFRPRISSIGTPTVNHGLLQGSPVVTHHPAAPVFIGFAKHFPLPIFVSDNDSAAANNMEVEDEDESAATATTTPTNQEEAIHMRSNRNNRSSKNKANHGSRPCNRQARRARKIKIGRRKRS